MQPPVWTKPRVPNGYWTVRANRVRYMLWLGKRLGYTRTDHWYNVTREIFHRHRGGGLLATVYHDSPSAAVIDCFPKTEWLPWRFRSTPQRYWADPANRRLYMTWLAGKLRIRREDDWQRVTRDDFYENEGGGLLSNYYHNSVSAALREYLKQADRLAWEFASVPQGFWHDPENLGRYVRWLAKRLGFRRREHYYRLTRRHFIENRGATALVACDGSPYKLLCRAIPEYDWKPWLFARVPRGYWNQRKNRKAYLVWLGKELGYRRPTDWYHISRADFQRTGGGALLNMKYNNGVLRALRERYPDYPWNVDRLYSRNGYGQMQLFEKE